MRQHCHHGTITQTLPLLRGHPPPRPDSPFDKPHVTSSLNLSVLFKHVCMPQDDCLNDDDEMTDDIWWWSWRFLLFILLLSRMCVCIDIGVSASSVSESNETNGWYGLVQWVWVSKKKGGQRRERGRRRANTTERTHICSMMVLICIDKLKGVFFSIHHTEKKHELRLLVSRAMIMVIQWKRGF